MFRHLTPKNESTHSQLNWVLVIRSLEHLSGEVIHNNELRSHIGEDTFEKDFTASSTR